MFFLGGREGKRKRQVMVIRVGRWTTRAFKQPHFVIYYMLSSGGFAAACLQTIAKGVLDPRCPGQCTCSVQASTTRRPVPHMRTVKGLLHLVPPRTPRSSGYDVYAHAVYVVICYMSITCYMLLYVMSVICYMSVICLVLGPSCYMYMSVICCYVLYVCYMLYVYYMSSARGGSRVRLYIIYAHLCNHILLQSGGGTWDTSLYTVRGVGSGSQDVDAWRANGSVRRVSGAPSTDDPGSWSRHLQRQIRAGV
jgi:hypothetical protein